MSAPVVELAEEVKRVVNHGPWNPSLNAERKWQLYFELPDLATTKVVVYPRADDTTGKIDRERWGHELKIHIAVQKKISSDDAAETGALVALADEICEHVKANRPARPEKLTTATVIPLVQNERMQQNKVFASLVELTFTAHR